MVLNSPKYTSNLDNLATKKYMSISVIHSMKCNDIDWMQCIAKNAMNCNKCNNLDQVIAVVRCTMESVEERLKKPYSLKIFRFQISWRLSAVSRQALGQWHTSKMRYHRRVLYFTITKNCNFSISRFMSLVKDRRRFGDPLNISSLGSIVFSILINIHTWLELSISECLSAEFNISVR